MEVLPLGVVCDARRLVRDGGRSGVVGREGMRVRECDEFLRRPDEDVCWAGVVVVAIVSLSIGLLVYS